MKSYFNRQALEAIHKECLDLGQRKNHDYGACGDAIAMAGVPGVVVRMLDKQLRLMSLTKAGHVQAVNDESLRDTLKDMINYATYAVSLMDGTWGKAPMTERSDVPKPSSAKGPLPVTPTPTHKEPKQ